MPSKKSKKIIAKEILYLLSTITIILIYGISIIVYNSVMGTIAINKREKAYELNDKILEASKNIQFIENFHTSLIFANYQVPESLYIFAVTLNEGNTSQLLFDQLKDEKFPLEISFKEFKNKIAKVDEIRTYNSLVTRKEKMWSQHMDYHQSKLDAPEFYDLGIKVILAWLILIYPVRLILIGFIWSINTLRN